MKKIITIISILIIATLAYADGDAVPEGEVCGSFPKKLQICGV